MYSIRSLAVDLGGWLGRAPQWQSRRPNEPEHVFVVGIQQLLSRTEMRLRRHLSSVGGRTMIDGDSKASTDMPLVGRGGASTYDWGLVGGQYPAALWELGFSVGGSWKHIWDSR